MTTAPTSPCCPIVELRQYTMRPGRRDELIELFDRELVEPQEATGMRVIGQFRDLDRPDYFVWLRGFASMPERLAALTEFYSSPLWKARRDAVNAPLIDSDDVLLLHPIGPDSGFPERPHARPGLDSSEIPAGVLVGTIHHLAAPADEELIARWAGPLREAARECGAPWLAAFATEQSPNDYPGLPVREGENVLVDFALHADAESERASREAMARSATWNAAIEALRPWSLRAPEILRLTPTGRSRLRASV